MKERFPENHIPVSKPKKELSEEASHELEPKINFTFYFTPHAFEKDSEKFGEILSEADIYVPESPGWDPDIAQVYDDISQGILDPKKAGIDNPAKLRELDFLYGSKKLVILLDITGGIFTKINRQRENFTGKVFEAKGLFLSGRFEQAVALARESAKGLAAAQEERERAIRIAMVEVLPTMLKQHPEFEEKLKKDRPLNVLLSLGATHTQLYHTLRQAGVSAEREFSEKPLTFPQWHELERRYTFGKEVSDEQVARSLLEFMLSKYIKEVGTGSQEEAVVMRKLVSPLSLRQIENISTQTGVIGKSFIDALAQAGVRVPRTRQEFEELLKN